MRVCCSVSQLERGLISSRHVLFVVTLTIVVGLVVINGRAETAATNKTRANDRFRQDVKIVSSRQHLVGTREIPLIQATVNVIGTKRGQSRETPSDSETDYRCAKYCICTIIRVFSNKKSRSNNIEESSSNGNDLIRAKCESSLFSDLLSLDRRTQIIHISLPKSDDRNRQDGIAGDGDSSSFRMPRMIQFTQLREIVIINLKFQVCDTEVFKKGQKLRRLQLNHNQLNRLSKACFKNLDRLIDLNLDYNELEELESALFSALTNLRSLSIAQNKLTDLAAHQFANLTHLISLNLVGNNFKEINLHLLEPMRSSLMMLLLSNNKIKTFTYTQSIITSISKTLANSTIPGTKSLANPNLAGVFFKNLIKLNVDNNLFERIKSLQLHRFFNIKFLSIRYNNIATIRDKAFNGLKLIELNLAHNKLHTILKCAFCNTTIKRLVLSNNNISMMQSIGSNLMFEPPKPIALARSGAPSELVLNKRETPLYSEQAQSSQNNMLIISRSVFGPLFSQLEYLDLSNNEFIFEQLESLLEPLLRLEYLNLAVTGLDRSLPSPSLFKNLENLRYLNLSHNQLDQIVATTVETLTKLEVLDISNNKFSELEESFLVAIDELPSLKIMNLASNPWLCTQCKISPLYDWILRSPIYNRTCISQTNSGIVEGEGDDSSESNDEATSIAPKSEQDSMEEPSEFYKHDFSLLGLSDEEMTAAGWHRLESANLDFDLIGLSNNPSDHPQDNGFSSSNYNLLGTNTDTNTLNSITRDFSSSQDDMSIEKTLGLTFTTNQADSTSDQRLNNYLKETEFCLKCEFPRELRSYNIHELSTSDFRFCAGSAPRFSASEPKIGLTLAIVIILTLLFIIIVVIIVYRKKSNVYYPAEDIERIDKDGTKKPVFSISSSVDQQPFEATDYSSPPLSQSFESFSTGSKLTGDEIDDEEIDVDVDDEDDEIIEEDEDEDEEEADFEENRHNQNNDMINVDIEIESDGNGQADRISESQGKHNSETAIDEQSLGRGRNNNTFDRQNSQTNTRSSSKMTNSDSTPTSSSGRKISREQTTRTSSTLMEPEKHEALGAHAMEYTSSATNVNRRERKSLEKVVRTGQNVKKWANNNAKSRHSKGQGSRAKSKHHESQGDASPDVRSSELEQNTPSQHHLGDHQPQAKNGPPKQSHATNERIDSVTVPIVSQSTSRDTPMGSQTMDREEASSSGRKTTSADSKSTPPIPATRKRLGKSEYQASSPLQGRTVRSEAQSRKPLWTSGMSDEVNGSFARFNSVDSADIRRLDWANKEVNRVVTMAEEPSSHRQRRQMNIKARDHSDKVIRDQTANQTQTQHTPQYTQDFEWQLHESEDLIQDDIDAVLENSWNQPALEGADTDSEMEQEIDYRQARGNEQKGLRSMAASASNHSALTQTSSQDIGPY